MNALEDIIEHFCRLPGIGKKSAARLAYHLLRQPPEQAQSLAAALQVLHTRINPCSECGAFTDQPLCSICSDLSRDSSVICVVEQPQDVETMAQLNEYRGLFHVLGGVIAPLEGVGPEKLSIAQLIKRINEKEIKEVILATNPTVEGDTTALYLQKILSSMPLDITRLASGIPAGGGLEYTDTLTLMRSFKGRIKVK